MHPTKDEAAARLAKAHLAVEPGITHIVRLRSDAAAEEDAAEPIKLLEVNPATFAAGVRPVYFAPSPARGLPYPCAIVDVTPDEFEQIESGDLLLPNGWTLAEVLVPKKSHKVVRR